ncbi:polyprenyl synthetase family protein [Nocardia pseudobrasiliensis]|uniref:Polyprenyl synthetase n=2 Tax=Nocardia pseudobrasiliensis TaxID=45979 RepID=A0A370ICN2_9NOCA|nr:polyprenyl synthetase family protein [Nocardia pseudobrasiliensis]RDI68463.1 polyprenyl synthetase [Nocardia pseudobrasiliensis]
MARPLRPDGARACTQGLTLAAATACGAEPAVAIPAAIATELIHAGRLRCGRATARSVWGIREAICLGDALHTLAIHVLVAQLPNTVTTPAVARLETVVTELCRGQCEDSAFETSHAVSVQDYLAMVMGKTGALIGCACALGGLCARTDTTSVAALETFGHELSLVCLLAPEF